MKINIKLRFITLRKNGSSLKEVLDNTQFKHNSDLQMLIETFLTCNIGYSITDERD
jgi:hypothetical protein